MIRSCTVCTASGTDPYENLAAEQLLLERVGEGELVLYLWQNARTVVIGRNQNPWKECRTALLAEEGGHLARRLSGGGAVFHDLGNLNFTFLLRQEDYDLSRQLSVIEGACLRLGVPVERSGRNDLLADGRKFSGNAFYRHKGRAYHHGTLMVDVDTELAQRYLSPPRAKLQARGVDSVRSRVVNLREFVPELSVKQLSEALIDALAAAYCPGTSLSALPVRALLDPDELASLTAHYGSEDWLCGPKLPLGICCEERFAWGGVELQLDVREGVIQAVKLYTDAMDEHMPEQVEAALKGLRFRPDSVRAALEKIPHGAEIASLLR